MYFVTNEPKLINTETGTVMSIHGTKDQAYVALNNHEVKHGPRSECEDFVYSIAGWVGAVNPENAPEE